MRKLAMRLLVMLATFLIGVVAWYPAFLYSEIRDFDENYVVPMQIFEITGEAPKAAEKERLKTCTNEKLYVPRYDWKYKGSPISLGIANKRILCGILPEYPQSLRNKVSGIVKVQIDISETGEVTRAAIMSGNKILHKSALQAARQTRFVPVLLRGQACRAAGVLIYEFDGVNGVRLQN